jgi:putative membrane protein
MNTDWLFAIERPSPELLKLYALRSLLTGPGFIIVFPVLLIRYLTLRYKFDNEGISMRWGFIFRREVNLAYSRIQDIHLSSGLIQRWMKLADIMIQTASGNAAAEMRIEGLHQYDEIRSFLYARMHGSTSSPASPGLPQSADVFSEILAEIRGARLAMEKLAEDSRHV